MRRFFMLGKSATIRTTAFIMLFIGAAVSASHSIPAAILLVVGIALRIVYLFKVRNIPSAIEQEASSYDLQKAYHRLFWSPYVAFGLAIMVFPFHV